jgi:type IV secretion system protein VirB9
MAIAQSQSDLETITRILQEEALRQQQAQQPPPAQGAQQNAPRQAASTRPAQPAAPVIQQGTAIGGQGAAGFADNILVGDMGPPDVNISPNDRTNVRPMAQDTRLVTFRYREGVAYEIRARVGMITHIVFPQEERIRQVALSDSANWEFSVSDDQRRIFIRPLVANAVNTGVIITDRREYEVVLGSYPPGSVWYQRVNWDQSHVGAVWKSPEDRRRIDPNRLNFNYEVNGKSRTFIVRQAYDDGERTYFVVDPRRQFPMIVRKIGRRQDEIVPYIVEDDRIVVDGIAELWEARLGNEKVTIRGR